MADNRETLGSDGTTVQVPPPAVPVEGGIAATAVASHLGHILFCSCWLPLETRLEAAPGHDVLASFAQSSTTIPLARVAVRKHPACIAIKLGGCTPTAESPLCFRCSNPKQLVLTLPVKNGDVGVDDLQTQLQTFQCRLHPDEVRLPGCALRTRCTWRFGAFQLELNDG